MTLNVMFLKSEYLNYGQFILQWFNFDFRYIFYINVYYLNRIIPSILYPLSAKLNHKEASPLGQGK